MYHVNKGRKYSTVQSGGTSKEIRLTRVSAFHPLLCLKKEVTNVHSVKFKINPVSYSRGKRAYRDDLITQLLVLNNSHLALTITKTSDNYEFFPSAVGEIFAQWAGLDMFIRFEF